MACLLLLHLLAAALEGALTGLGNDHLGVTDCALISFADLVRHDLATNASISHDRVRK
jgi:hypothetical protein